MSLGPTKGQNTRRGVGRIGGGIVDELNELSPGLGTRLAREINQRLSQLGTRLDAQAGHRGSVVVAKQRVRDATLKTKPGVLLNSDRVAGVADPIDDEDAVNLRYFRRFRDCDWFAQMAEDCLELDEAALAGLAGGGEAHAMWGYTYEIPNFTDTVNGDPGFLEATLGAYWQFIIPVTTVVDQVSWRRTDASFTNTIAGVAEQRIGLYDCNQSPTAYPRVAQTAAQDLLLTTANTNYTLPLDVRVTLDPGMYLIALTAPCYNSMLSIQENAVVWNLINSAYSSILPELGSFPRYGLFTSAGPLPDQIDSSNIFAGSADLMQEVPLLYFSDTQEFL